MTSRLLWSPSPQRSKQSNLACFVAGINQKHGLSLGTFPEIHDFSVSRTEDFWVFLWEFAKVKAETRGGVIISTASKMRESRFFPQARLNYAENMLAKTSDEVALIFRGEDKIRSTLTWRQLVERSAQFARALEAMGIKAGDRVCAVVPNMPEAIVALLGCASIGAIWSSCSPDFGERGILDRFGQISPRILLCCDGYYYNGKPIDLHDKVESVLKQLPSVEKAIVIPYAGGGPLSGSIAFEEFLAPYSSQPFPFAQLPFDHPLYILFSSGTTGIPKCIVHSAGGMVLKHASEHLLQCDLKESDRLFYFSTCGWMMWNWLVSGLAAGATLLLYDGSPFHPSPQALFDYADEEQMTIFGTSAKYIDAVKKTGWLPKETHKLDSLRTMLSTGSPLAPESFDFVYEGIKSDIHLGSISGGTDICGCFVAGNPLTPVWRGEIQGPVLGMAVDVLDEQGEPLSSGKGELVCTKPFPSMPVMFWNDSDNAKFDSAYFLRFENIWCHGDFAEWTEHHGLIIHGRSDATLNPGGVRIGTAEIYAQVEAIPEVIEALAVGQEWDNDVRVVLFVKLKSGLRLDEHLQQKIKKQIRTGASPRHVPAKIVEVNDIPRTKSGKITELAVRDVIHGREVKNKEALANPEALLLYRDIAELKV